MHRLQGADAKRWMWWINQLGNGRARQYEGSHASDSEEGIRIVIPVMRLVCTTCEDICTPIAGISCRLF